MALILTPTVAEQILTNGSDSYIYTSGIALFTGTTPAFETVGSGNEFYYRIYDLSLIHI